MPYSFCFRWRLYRHIALDFLEFLWGRYGCSIKLHPSDATKYKELKERGGLLLVAHFHNWELLGGWLCQGGMPLRACAKPLANPLADAFLNRARRRIGLPTLTSDWSRQSLRALKAGQVVAFLWDQRPEKTATSFSSTFLGHRVEMNRLPAALTEKGIFPICFGALLPGGEVRLVSLGKSPVGKEKLARRYNRVLGKLVLRHPDYWYGWAHRRFIGF